MTMDAAGNGTVRNLPTDASADLPRLEPDDGAALLYTSGTTGRPKGALLTHANLVHNSAALVDLWGFTETDVLLHVLPLFHTHGLFVASHCVLASGASMVLLPAFEVDAALRALPRCTVMMGVPTHYSRLLHDPRFDADLVRHVRLSSRLRSDAGAAARCVHSANGADGARAVRHDRDVDAHVELPGRRPQTRIGRNSSAWCRAACRQAVTVRWRPGSWAKWRYADQTCSQATGAVRSCRARLSPMTDFRTGDLGRLDDDGYLELVGRSKDLVISGGLNVYPRDVEEVLDGIAGVRESAVVGVPDSDLGERVVAMVVGDPEVDPEGVRAAARERLGVQGAEAVLLVDELPRNAMGKVDKVALRATAIELGG